MSRRDVKRGDRVKRAAALARHRRTALVALANGTCSPSRRLRRFGSRSEHSRPTSLSGTGGCRASTALMPPRCSSPTIHDVRVIGFTSYGEATIRRAFLDAGTAEVIGKEDAVRLRTTCANSPQRRAPPVSRASTSCVATSSRVSETTRNHQSPPTCRSTRLSSAHTPRVSSSSRRRP
jgi:hypothetical protein